jgi:hypothetical protein
MSSNIAQRIVLAVTATVMVTLFIIPPYELTNKYGAQMSLGHALST